MAEFKVRGAWLIDAISHPSGRDRCVELWEPSDIEQPIVILHGIDAFDFAGITFTVDSTFAILTS